MFDDFYFSEFDAGLNKSFDKPRVLESPVFGNFNYTEEQINRLICSYNQYLDKNSYLSVSVRVGRVSKKTGKSVLRFSVYNMKCRLIFASNLKNVWTVYDNDSVVIFKGVFEDCLRYLIKYWFVVPREDVKMSMLDKI